MAKKVITGTIETTMKNKNQHSVSVVTIPATPPKDGKPGTPAKGIAITASDLSILEGIDINQKITITIETK